MNVNKTQKEVVQFYFDELNKENDITVLIEQAKALQNMVVNESLRGNDKLIKYFTKIGEFLIKCYDNLPQENKDQKSSIEEAIAILTGIK